MSDDLSSSVANYLTTDRLDRYPPYSADSDPKSVSNNSGILHRDFESSHIGVILKWSRAGLVLRARGLNAGTVPFCGDVVFRITNDCLTAGEPYQFPSEWFLNCLEVYNRQIMLARVETGMTEHPALTVRMERVELDRTLEEFVRGVKVS